MNIYHMYTVYILYSVYIYINIYHTAATFTLMRYSMVVVVVVVGILFY